MNQNQRLLKFFVKMFLPKMLVTKLLLVTFYVKPYLTSSLFAALYTTSMIRVFLVIASEPHAKLPCSRRKARYFLLPPRTRRVWILKNKIFVCIFSVKVKFNYNCYGIFSDYFGVDILIRVVTNQGISSFVYFIP